MTGPGVAAPAADVGQEVAAETACAVVVGPPSGRDAEAATGTGSERGNAVIGIEKGIWTWVVSEVAAAVVENASRGADHETGRSDHAAVDHVTTSSASATLTGRRNPTSETSHWESRNPRVKPSSLWTPVRSRQSLSRPATTSTWARHHQTTSTKTTGVTRATDKRHTTGTERRAGSEVFAWRKSVVYISVSYSDVSDMFGVSM